MFAGHPPAPQGRLAEPASTGGPSFYRESERFGQLCGVGKDIRPASYQDFQDYYARTLSRLTAGDQARSVARMILRARLRGIPVPPWGYLLAAGLLPAPLRAQYGLRWSAAQRALWWLFTHATHVVMCRLAPPRIRFWDHYHVAVVRCRPADRTLRYSL